MPYPFLAAAGVVAAIIAAILKLVDKDPKAIIWLIIIAIILIGLDCCLSWRRRTVA